MKLIHISHLLTYFKCFFLLTVFIVLFSCSTEKDESNEVRRKISINENWRFFKYENADDADKLIYDTRPELEDIEELRVADAEPSDAEVTNINSEVLKPWILASSNKFIKDPSKHHIRPESNPGYDFPFVQKDFDDSAWELVDLPHDWAIAGPFQEGWDTEVGGGMGRLPSNGIAWYRKKLDVSSIDVGKSIFLDIDGAMSYAMVWLNGNLVGGWPYGYNSFRLDLTPFIIHDAENQLAIRLDNPNFSARWYPGGGIYRNVWLTITEPAHISQWGTFITTNNISDSSAQVNVEVIIDNNYDNDVTVNVVNSIYFIDKEGVKSKSAVAVSDQSTTTILAKKDAKVEQTIEIENPNLWGPLPTQIPNLYLAVTEILEDNKLIDRYETTFGIRSLEFNPQKGIFVNGEHIQIKGVNQHHDLGALGTAFNIRAAERQLEILQEMGCNAIRMAHNPPAPELLDLTDKMGFLVVDEVFDSWERKKTPYDFHLIFKDWYEQDTRSMVRRDKNHPSIIMWSFGNEVGEQYTDKEGAELSEKLRGIVKDEDPSRLTTTSMNFAKPNMPFAATMDVIGLNYQGEGIRQDPEFEGTDRIRTAPQHNAFHEQFPDKVIFSSESASALSSRGFYMFPVSKKNSDIVREGYGGDSVNAQVSSYELHAVDFGSSAEKVFASLEKHPFVAGEFVWNGWDYLGEPTPYYSSRSSYSGIIDLAGFKKDRYYLYQSHWRPDFPMVHILPHWNWPERVGEITPVHVFTSGDEVELFLNGESLGRKKKEEFEYRLRWDDVIYQEGELKAVAYKNGEEWSEKIVQTTGEKTKLQLVADRSIIDADGKDLSFITVEIADENGHIVPRTNDEIEFFIDGPGEIVATDNGNSADLVAFPSHIRNAFNGLALVIVKANNGEAGEIKVTAKSKGLKDGKLSIRTK